MDKKHKFNYNTPYGGWVCTCQRYFDDKESLAVHCLKENCRKLNTNIVKGESKNDI